MTNRQYDVERSLSMVRNRKMNPKISNHSHRSNLLSLRGDCALMKKTENDGHENDVVRSETATSVYRFIVEILKITHSHGSARVL